MRSNVYLRNRKTKKGESRYTLIVREYGQRERHIPLGAVSKKIAEERRIQLLHELMTGSYQREPVIHVYFSEFVEKFFSDFANGSRSPKTVRNYRCELKPVLCAFKGRRLNQISRHDLERYLSSYKASNRTRNILLSILRLVFAKAVQWGHLTASPMEGIRRFPEACHGSRALTPHELNKLWDGLTAWQRAVMRILIYSGMRPGELSNLKFQDIDWEGKRLGIVTDRTRQTKNRKTRYIPMNEDLQEELNLLKDFLPVRGGHLAGEYKKREPHQKEYVLCNRNGSKVNCFRHAIKRAFKTKGITGVTPHGLRKTFCSQLARYKVHPRVAQQLVGHSDIRLTMKVYTEVDDDQLREAMSALPTMKSMQDPQLRLVVGI